MTTISGICQRRLQGDLKMVKTQPLEYIDASPDESNILLWYFLIKGPEYSEYSGGYFIGKIIFSPEYPLKAPDFMMLTPNGRFDDGHKICLTNSGYHSNEWSAAWTINAILVGFLSIMLDDKEHGISHIRRSKDERKNYAQNSVEYNKKHHTDIIKLFTRFLDINGNPRSEEEQKIKLKPIRKQLAPVQQTAPIIQLQQQQQQPVVEHELIIPNLNQNMKDQPKVDETNIEQPKIDVLTNNKKKDIVSTTIKNFNIDDLKKQNYTKTESEYIKFDKLVQKIKKK